MPGILQHKLAQLYISCTYHCDSSKKDQGHMPDTFRRRSSPQPHTCLFLPGADGTMGQRCGSNVADRGRSMILEHWTTLQGPICSSCLVILWQMLTWTLPIGHRGTRGDRKGFYITEQNVQVIGSNKYFQHGECVDKKLYLSCFDDL